MKDGLKIWTEVQPLIRNLNDAGRISLQSDFPPANGWIAFMRNTLGMSRRNLANLMDSKISIVKRDEYREKNGQLKLGDLKTYATPLYSKLSWTFLPDQTIWKKTNHAKTELVNLTINQLTELAEQQNCRFLYVLLPNKSIEKIRTYHANKVAKHIVNYVNDLMILENQALPPKKLKEHKKYLAEMILSQPSHKFWVAPR